MLCCTGDRALRLKRVSPSTEPTADDDGRVGNPASICTTAAALEHAMQARIAFPDPPPADDQSTDDSDVPCEEDPVTVYVSDDAYLLKCRRPNYDVTTDEHGSEAKPRPQRSLFGVEENASLARSDRHGEGGHLQRGTDLNVRVSMYELTATETVDGCRCSHPRGRWTRCRPPSEKSRHHAIDDSGVANAEDVAADIKLIDLTPFQRDRRCRSDSDDKGVFLDSPGTVFHVLRSVLHCVDGDGRATCPSHCASPWVDSYEAPTDRTTNESGQKSISGVSDAFHHRHESDRVVSFLLSNTVDGTSPSDELEEREILEFLKFRTGDAAPSYYLHAAAHVANVRSESGNGSMFQEIFRDLIGIDETNHGIYGHHRQQMRGAGGVLLVYRHIPPRDILAQEHPLKNQNDRVDQVRCENGEVCNGSWGSACLWETYLPPPPQDTDHSQSEPVSVTKGGHGDSPTQQFLYRKVSPPYLCHSEEYSNLLKEFLKSENLAAIQEEALSIPQWTAWPERQHYQSTGGGDTTEGDETNESGSPYPASWTVFPLCHTFPATDASKRVFISKTCAFVPRTTTLLCRLGPMLRTALFSRLDPETTLAAHTGWADLANHVLRIHIPVVVPTGGRNEGLCGTWVDGCVETHDTGRIICFDDSKVHRAFNYSNEDRIVLIIDVERPHDLPQGTATGGHSEELDAFIEQLS